MTQIPGEFLGDDSRENPSPADTAKALAEMELPAPPQGWVRWLEKGKCVQAGTSKLYRHIVSQFLAVVKIVNPNKDPSLGMAWDSSFCGLFFETMAESNCDSTIVNFHNALISVRTYLRRVGHAPPNAGVLLEDFRDMQKAAIQRKKVYINTRKESKEGHGGILWLLYRRVYHGTEFLRKFYHIGDRFKAAARDKIDVRPLKRSELSFCNEFLLTNLSTTNFHRTGNLPQIEYEVARKEIVRAQKVLGKRMNGQDLRIIHANRRLNRSQCEPAIIKVEGGMKHGGVIKFVILNPRDQDLLRLYFHIRNNCPKPIKTTKLFVNANGESVANSASTYIRKMGQRAQIKGLTCQLIRSLIETENVLDENANREAVSQHLGHTQQTRKQYYVIEDKRHSVQAANRLLWKLEDIGEADYPQVRIE